MSLIPAAVTTATALGVAGVPAGLALPQRVRGWAVGGLTAGVGVAGGTSGVAALGGSSWAAEVPGLLPLAGAHLAVDALSGLFMAVAGTVVAAVAVYGVGYVAGPGSHGPYGLGSRGAQALLPLFAVSLVLVPAAASVSTFLLLWELMALTSLLLVLAEDRSRPTVREAAVWYAVMTHLGLVLLLVGLSVYAAQAGGETFTALRSGSEGSLRLCAGSSLC